jgi:hypothetical protein
MRNRFSQRKRKNFERIMAEGKLKILLDQSLTALPWESLLSERKVVLETLTAKVQKNFDKVNFFVICIGIILSKFLE